MSTGRPCKICGDAEKTKLVAALVMEGLTDQAIANRLGGLHRMAISRHRRNHLEAPAAAVAKAAAKGRDAVEQRAQTLAAAEAGDPSAFVALAGIVNDLRRVNDRLERTAAAAESDNQRLAVASLSAQQLRSAEVRARLGTIGAYSPKTLGSGEAGATFNLVMQFSGGRETRITATSVAPGTMIETMAEPVGDSQSEGEGAYEDEDV